MFNLAICIPTYKRPLMLRKLTDSIMKGNVNKLLINDLYIVIVDNDADRTAENTVLKLKNKYSGKYKIEYINYPFKGLSDVRNELLKSAFKFAPDFIVFIDDDEYVSVNWLNNLLETTIKNNADMTIGPVIPAFDDTVPENVASRFRRKTYKRDTRISSIITGNLMIRVETLLKNNIWFNTCFNKTGGEDSYFGKEMLKKGAVAYWSKNAVAFETIPENRSNIQWLIKRVYNGANIYTYILKIDNEYIMLMKKLFISIFYVIAGIISLVLVLFSIKIKYWGLLKLSEGIGGIAGLLNIRYYEYK